MVLFLVHHKHDADRCPAQDPYMGAMLLNHLSRPNARQHGVEIRSEAVVGGEHTLYMIVESADKDRVAEFVKPFATIGSVAVHPASSCVRVVASGGCGFAMPTVAAVPSLDPEEACQRAIDAGLVVHRAHPLNCETSIPALIGGAVMPNAHFYVRNHFQIPLLDPAAWRLTIGGLVERSLSLSLREVRNLPARTLAVTLECAGNGRATLPPPVEGEKWGFGAVSTAEWTGVSLREVLDRAGVRPGAQEVLFRGADIGTSDERRGTVRFERSLPLAHARDPDLLLAYAMNGEPLPVQHGFPLRLVVPGWYAVASVKWLTEIQLIERPFDGAFQGDRYIFERDEDGRTLREPVRFQRVRSLITEPDPAEVVPRGELAIRGVAWSGLAAIARVEVSIDGSGWQVAQLSGERRPHAWQGWELLTRAERSGRMTLRSRATDSAGRTQPDRPEWNRLGYGNNAVQEISVQVA